MYFKLALCIESLKSPLISHQPLECGSVQVVKLLPEQAFSPTGPPLYYLFNFILLLLLVLHIYWWILIAKVIYRQIAGSGLDDVRSGESAVCNWHCVANAENAYILLFCEQCR